MNHDALFSIKVPGSTANLGPGFDSIGLAVNRYLVLDVYLSKGDWEVIPMTAEVMNLSSGPDNLIVQTALTVAKEFGKVLPACKIYMSSDIPISRGLGSSASAIVGGIELANRLLELNLTMAEKAHRASLFEGHPDNVTASLYGGLVIGNHNEEETTVIFGEYPDLDLVALIPDYELKTTDSRGLLPEIFTYKDAVKASSISNVLVAAMLKNHWDIAGKMMLQDLFHQPYRRLAIPELDQALAIVSQLDCYGLALSGAGPTVMFYAREGEGENLKSRLADFFPGYAIDVLQVDRKGLEVQDL